MGLRCFQRVIFNGCLLNCNRYDSTNPRDRLQDLALNKFDSPLGLALKLVWQVETKSIKGQNSSVSKNI